MKLIMIALALALSPLLALATGKHPPGANANSTSAATSTASPIANSYGGTSGDAWAVALPGHGSPSYAGAYSICVQGKGILWNFAWSWSFDGECVRLIAELDRMRATPVPQKPVHYPMADAAPAEPAPVLSDASMQPGAVADCAGAIPVAEKPVRTAAARSDKAKPAKATKVAAATVGGCGK